MFFDSIELLHYQKAGMERKMKVSVRLLAFYFKVFSWRLKNCSGECRSFKAKFTFWLCQSRKTTAIVSRIVAQVIRLIGILLVLGHFSHDKRRK